jgi:DNA-binding MarR family transcriptional regulator
MAHDMISELRQTRPFAVSEEELYLSFIRTTDLLGRACHALLKDSGISPPQYNVLRILRGAGEAGLPCGEIAARMVTRDPDVTRLLDRLEQRGLIARGRGTEDRRVVSTRITGAGRALLNTLDPEMHELHQRQLGFLTADEQSVLLEQLTRVRAALDVEAPLAEAEAAAPGTRNP